MIISIEKFLSKVDRTSIDFLPNCADPTEVRFAKGFNMDIIENFSKYKKHVQDGLFQILDIQIAHYAQNEKCSIAEVQIGKGSDFPGLNTFSSTDIILYTKNPKSRFFRLPIIVMASMFYCAKIINKPLEEVAQVYFFTKGNEAIKKLINQSSYETNIAKLQKSINNDLQSMGGTCATIQLIDNGNNDTRVDVIFDGRTYYDWLCIGLLEYTIKHKLYAIGNTFIDGTRVWTPCFLWSLLCI